MSKAENALEILSRRLIKLQCVYVPPYISTIGLICILYLYVKTINEKRWHGFEKKSKEEYAGGFGVIKGMKKWCKYNINSKNNGNNSKWK